MNGIEVEEIAPIEINIFTLYSAVYYNALELLTKAAKKCDLCKAILNEENIENFTLPARDSITGLWLHYDKNNISTECRAQDLLENQYNNRGFKLVGKSQNISSEERDLLKRLLQAVEYE